MTALSRADCELIIESLTWTRRAFENYPYPTLAGRQARLAEVDATIARVRATRRQLPKAAAS